MALHKDVQSETDCLARLVTGEDVWPRFWDHFGRIIEGEVNRFFGADTLLLDDIYQELVLKLLAKDYRIIRRHLKRSHRGDFGALLRMTTRNMLIDIWRKHKRQGTLELLEADSYPEPSSTGIWGNPATTHLDERQVIDVLRQVTGRNSESTSFRILFLRFVEGESVNYIATQLNMKEDTVRHRIDYYLKKLRKEHGEVLMEMIDG